MTDPGARGRDDHDPEQEAEARTSRNGGGDSPSAGSVEEREAVAGGDDDLFGDDHDDT